MLLPKDKGDYPEKTDEGVDDNRFTTLNVPITAIAVSSLEDESGVFELNFRDDRYLPCEGAGVLSKWRIELPDKFRQFDYDTMTDVVIRLRYTSVDGGDKLKQPASDCVLDYIKSVEDLSQDEGLFAAFDLKNDFSDAGYTANHPPAAATERVLTIDKLNEKLPIHQGAFAFEDQGNRPLLVCVWLSDGVHVHRDSGWKRRYIHRRPAAGNTANDEMFCGEGR